MSFGLGQDSLVTAEISPVRGGGVTMVAVGASSLFRLRRGGRRHLINLAPKFNFERRILLYS